mgnify:CR=1 FL=1
MKNFVITISRGYGSGGKTIGKMLAQELDIPYYDSEILSMASEASGVNEGIFAQNDERLKGISLLKSIINKGHYMGDTSITKDFTSPENIFKFQARVIRELAEKESFVIIGRAADFVLKDFDNVISVNIQAPFDVCTRAIMKRNNVDAREAQRLIVKIDRERAEYYEFHTGNKWNDELNYDLSINTGKISWDKVVKLIKDFVNIKFEE